jgi:hypothetical protein
VPADAAAASLSDVNRGVVELEIGRYPKSCFFATGIRGWLLI